MISEPRNAAGVPGLHFYGRFCTIFPSISWATCHRQLSCTAKFLLFRHKRGTNAFFVHNFVIPYLYKHITQTEILLWNTTIGTRAGCSPPHSTRRWCARSARSFPFPRCGCRTRSSPCLTKKGCCTHGAAAFFLLTNVRGCSYFWGASKAMAVAPAAASTLFREMGATS